MLIQPGVRFPIHGTDCLLDSVCYSSVVDYHSPSRDTQHTLHNAALYLLQGNNLVVSQTGVNNILACSCFKCPSCLVEHS